MFFSLHDPTQLDRQGADVGTQYRSAMFSFGDDQRAAFEAARDRAAEWWPGQVVTTIEPLGEFFRAEEYHQDFFAKNPGQGYCMAVALPKVTKIRLIVRRLRPGLIDPSSTSPSFADSRTAR